MLLLIFTGAISLALTDIPTVALGVSEATATHHNGDAADAPKNAPENPAYPVAPAAPDDQKKICRSEARQTGSNMVRRVCRTKKDWDSNAARSQTNQGAKHKID